MKAPGQIVLFRFPYANLIEGKIRPALLLGRLPGIHGDWLLCMISSRLEQQVEGFDEIILLEDEDFVSSGLKIASLIRIGRLAVVEDDILIGSIGEISEARLIGIKSRLGRWITRNTI